mmetsp:Transcript_73737/g.213591  ORF Transcript_73737/g.213591 Transcript_73737/m.213591 type:complete len:456 (+) Transcript_73737:910-2277(+)
MLVALVVLRSRGDGGPVDAVRVRLAACRIGRLLVCVPGLIGCAGRVGVAVPVAVAAAAAGPPGAVRAPALPGLWRLAPAIGSPTLPGLRRRLRCYLLAVDHRIQSRGGLPGISWSSVAIVGRRRRRRAVAVVARRRRRRCGPLYGIRPLRHPLRGVRRSGSPLALRPIHGAQVRLFLPGIRRRPRAERIVPSVRGSVGLLVIGRTPALLGGFAAPPFRLRFLRLPSGLLFGAGALAEGWDKLRMPRGFLAHALHVPSRLLLRHCLLLLLRLQFELATHVPHAGHLDRILHLLALNDADHHGHVVRLAHGGNVHARRPGGEAEGRVEHALGPLCRHVNDHPGKDFRIAARQVADGVKNGPRRDVVEHPVGHQNHDVPRLQVHTVHLGDVGRVLPVGAARVHGQLKWVVEVVLLLPRLDENFVVANYDETAVPQVRHAQLPRLPVHLRHARCGRALR